MAFINKHDTVTIHTALTQEGRKRLADGDLRIERIAFSDAEINYGCGSGLTYSHLGNHLTSMPYRRGGAISMNYDGTPPYELDPNNVVSITESIEEPVPNLGFFTNISGGTNMEHYRVDTSLCTATGYTPTFYASGVGWFGFNPHFFRCALSGETNPPPEQGLVFIRFIIPGGGVPDYAGTNIGYYGNIFRYHYLSGTSTIEVDHTLPRYDFNPAPQKQQPMFFYPLSGYSNYYGSGTTTVCPIWNMNILSRIPQIGHEPSLITITTGANNDVIVPPDIAMTTYGSRNISGLVKSFGLDHLGKCGVLHYSNSYSGSVYGDYLVPRETQVDMPHILWYRNGGGLNGSSQRGGVKFVDAGSEIYYDTSGKTSYTLLKDGIGPSAMEVGRVYFEMKLIVITDQELLTAMDAKSNRNWTCPPLKLELVSQTDNSIINASGYTGLAETGKRYYITYHMPSYPGYGPRQSLPCAYVQTIDGQNDDDGNPMYIKATFPPNSFPFVRNSPAAMSGSGYNCNMVQLLIQEFDAADDPGPLALDPSKWRHARMNSLDLWENVGVSRFGIVGSQLYLTATMLNAITFYATRNEYEDYNYFRLNASANGGSIGQTLGLDEPFWPGDQEFFYGNITAKRMTKNYIRSVRFFVEKDYLNTSTNPTYISGSTFITEALLLGSDNKVLGVAKPDRPIEKNDITVIDFAFRSHY